jgi:hypothetical protein
MNGQCGTGEAFCGHDKCQWGNCVDFAGYNSTVPPPETGNTPDGTCGGVNGYTCSIIYGKCCNKDGVCGSLPTDCGTGW